jgi:ATP-dependent exoDNAse (exonuclease V) beta subunit
MANLHGDDTLTLETLRLAAEGAARAADQAGPPGIERVRGWPDLLVEAAAHIGWLRSAWERLPVDRFVAELRERLPLEACAAGRYLGDYRLANLSRFYADLVPALARGDSASALRALRDGLAGRREADDARPGDATARAVRVMTIHKSKGLEFPHVYLPQLHRGRRETNDRPALDEFDAREHDGGWEYKLFGTRSLGWDRVHEHVARIEQRERVRLLYVAMTRARDELRKDVASLAVAGASRLLQREIDPKAHADLIEQLAREIEGAKA